MKKTKLSAIACLLMLMSLPGYSQVLSENFSNGLPVSWAQLPSSSWNLNTTIEAAGNGCIYTQNTGSSADTTSIYTPTLQLTGVTNLTVTFKASIIGNNFLPPNIVLSYDAGAGKQFLARWGNGFSTNTTYTITDYGYDYQSPLDAENVHWLVLSHTFTAASGSAASFAFDAELYNGGYAVLDSIVIFGQGVVATGLEENKRVNLISVFPNPLINKQVVIEGEPVKSVVITNGLGERVSDFFYDTGEKVVTINLHELPAGIYYLHAVTIENIPVSKKIVLK